MRAQEEQASKVTVSVGYGGFQINLGHCDLQLGKEGLEVARLKCNMTVPYTYITSCGKNQLTLLLFTSDPNSSGLSPDEYGEEEQEVSLDRVLFGMLIKTINQGKGSFSNILKGSFTVAITHPTLHALTHTRLAVEEELAKLEPQMQAGFAVEHEEES